MIQPTDPILIVGAGSVGERHLRNLLALGYGNLVAYRQRNLPFRTIDPGQVRVVTDFAEALALRPKAAFIASPTAQHLAQALACAEAGIHLLIEKPLSHTTEGLDRLKAVVARRGVYVQVGYMMRFHPLVRELKAIIDEGRYGRLLSFTTRWGEYLPNWHPWEDYRTSYAARKELGGGAALTLSHDLDLVLWLVPSPLRDSCTLPNRASALEVDVEAGMDFLLHFDDSTTGHVHLNFFEQPATRYLHFAFETGTVRFDYYANALKISTPAGDTVRSEEGFDRNQLFVDQTVHFFRKIGSFDPAEALAQIEQSERIIHLCDKP
ncbi:MAG: Gfo/Idh/MocA family oxidoreductase [Cytophagales bacterium]|nr:Gfo/Idh/MocA family oxidoreductase [Cytophagales bacterium]